MANGEEPEEDTSNREGAADVPPPTTHRSADPAVAPHLLGAHHPVVHRGRPRWTTVALVLIFAAVLILYLALGPGG